MEENKTEQESWGRGQQNSNRQDGKAEYRKEGVRHCFTTKGLVAVEKVTVTETLAP